MNSFVNQSIRIHPLAIYLLPCLTFTPESAHLELVELFLIKEHFHHYLNMKLIVLFLIRFFSVEHLISLP
ncbi:Ovule protein [Caenorhabditis elegans]|uniref:Ovule protein n=1 Tax=Caenorhabditis elegans TaxID=6239 RepID=Q2V4X1_CAEEL|nr:Ovule protein [Caenorhabditis elegans]CCD63534.2 Ovule protein [Caenorhabditis elegans]